MEQYPGGVDELLRAQATEPGQIGGSGGCGVGLSSGFDSTSSLLDRRPAGLDDEHGREAITVDSRRKRVDGGKIAKRHGGEDYRHG
jgi:hypothetical protein